MGINKPGGNSGIKYRTAVGIVSFIWLQNIIFLIPTVFRTAPGSCHF